VIGPFAACTRCESAVDRGDDRCAVCGLVVSDSGPADLPVTAVEVLRCDGCGAAVSYSVEAGAPQCAFCGSTLHLEAPEDPLEQAQLLVPFTVRRSQAEEVFGQWLGSLGWFRPMDLKPASRLETMRALWWTGWVIEADALVSWAADSDVGAGRADWAPHVGRAEMRIEDVVAPSSRGLTDDETRSLLDSYDLDSAVDPHLVVGPDGAVERFELLRSEARRHVRSVIDSVVDDRLRSGVIPGRRFRNVRAEVLLRRLSARRMGLPAWVIAYRYRGRLHRFVLSGQDPDRRMGDAPISVAKIVLTMTAGVIALISLLTLLLG
jgi:hypothetical protein